MHKLFIEAKAAITKEKFGKSLRARDIKCREEVLGGLVHFVIGIIFIVFKYLRDTRSTTQMMMENDNDDIWDDDDQ